MWPPNPPQIVYATNMFRGLGHSLASMTDEWLKSNRDHECSNVIMVKLEYSKKEPSNKNVCITTADNLDSQE